jgi:hypothetical protein
LLVSREKRVLACRNGNAHMSAPAVLLYNSSCENSAKVRGVLNSSERIDKDRLRAISIVPLASKEMNHAFPS